LITKSTSVAEPVLRSRYGAEDEYRPIITAGGRRRGAPASTSRCRASRRCSAHLGDEPRALNDCRFQYAYAKYEVSPPYSHGDWEPADFTARLPLCTPVFTIRRSRRRLRQRADGPEARWQVKDDFSYLMHAWAGRTSGRWASTSATSRSRATHRLAARQLDVPEGRAVQRQRSDHLSDAVHELAADLREHSDEDFAGYIQDDWQAASGLTLNLGLRYDLQKGSFNEDVPRLLASIQDKLGRDGSFPLDVSVVKQPKSGRGDYNNFGPRVGLAWDPQNNGVMNIHARTGCSTTTCDAAELQRADVAAGEADHHHQADLPRSAGRQVSRLVHHHGAAEHHRAVERHGERLRASVQRRREPDRGARHRRDGRRQHHEPVLRSRHD
jgi:hypothetical protein